MRGRFAPSPTGRLHLGNARTALLAWLQARAAGGTFLLRIEDLDAARCRPAFEEDLKQDLAYLGLDWDEPPLRQSERAGLYRDALARLGDQVYPCFCTRAEIARAASAPHGPGDDGPRYPGTCASLTASEREARAQVRRPALRFRVPPGAVSFSDQVHGPTRQDVLAEVGDFVVQRNDGVASYQLAVVVDDAATGITDVLRADDLLSSTARQLLLYGALSAAPPRFAHVPLVLGVDGKRLAKREGAFAVCDLRQAGVPAERILGLLALWSGLSPGAPTSARALVPAFSAGALTRQATVAGEDDIRSRLGLV